MANVLQTEKSTSNPSTTSPGINSSSQSRAPVLEALSAYRGVIRFHMPGHKGGRSQDPQAVAVLGEKAYWSDVTGVPGMDDLHEPGGILAEAQKLAAEAWGADETYFLVNGTSSGIHAMILATVGLGDTIILPRNVHKSILAGLVLSGARPVFVPPVYDSYLGIAMGVAPESLFKAIREHPEAKAVLLVNPTYYGVSTRLDGLADAVHRAGMVLLVDEAHGPHFRFHPKLPAPALDSGADACAQGAHKILGAFTQASLLHIKGDRIDRARLKAAFQHVTSTSPSYLLLASLDAARRQMVLHGKDLLDYAINLAGILRAGVNEIPGLYSFGKEILGRSGQDDLDLTKVTVTVRELGITGTQAEMYLRLNENIQAEMSDMANVLFIVSPGNTSAEVSKLLEALRRMARDAATGQLKRDFPENGFLEAPPGLPEMVLTPKQAFESPWERVELEHAAGRVSAEVVTCYPPGIPLVFPGELITSDVVKHLRVIRDLGFRISGPEDRSLRTLRVVVRS